MDKQTIKIFKGDKCIAKMGGEYVLAAAIEEKGDGTAEMRVDSGCGMKTIEYLAIWLAIGREIRKETEIDLEKMIRLLRADDARQLVEEDEDAD